MTRIVSALLLIALLLPLPAAAQEGDYWRYKFKGVPSCNDEQREAFLAILIEAAVNVAVVDVSDRFLDVAKEQARTELIAKTTSQDSNIRGDARLEIYYAFVNTSFIDENYISIMRAFWDEPVLCRQTLETIQAFHDVRSLTSTTVGFFHILQAAVEKTTLSEVSMVELKEWIEVVEALFVGDAIGTQVLLNWGDEAKALLGDPELTLAYLLGFFLHP